MSDISQARGEMTRRVLKGDGSASPAQRRAAFDNAGLEGALATLVDKIASCPHQITDEDFGTAKAACRSEDQLFEVVICAALGQAGRQYDAALAALEAATESTSHATRDPR